MRGDYTTRLDWKIFAYQERDISGSWADLRSSKFDCVLCNNDPRASNFPGTKENDWHLNNQFMIIKQESDKSNDVCVTGSTRFSVTSR